MAEIDMTKPQPCTKFRDEPPMLWAAKLTEEASEAFRASVMLGVAIDRCVGEEEVRYAERRLAERLTYVITAATTALEAIGYDLAARHAGVTPVWASEIEPFPCSVTARHFPDVKQLGDITKIDPDTLPPIDIICAGSPCQDLSIAGKRKGLDGERSGLFRTAVDLVRRMRERTAGKYPRFFVWENVPGAFSSNRGMDFQAVLEEIGESEIPMPQGNQWAPAGLVQFPGAEIAWRVLDAQYWGGPQRRKRIFLVADFAAGKRCAGEILFERESVSGNPQESKGAGEGSTRGAENCARTSGEYIPKTARTLTARMDGSPCADRGPQIVATNALTPWDVQSRRIYDENGTMAALYSGDGQGTHNGAVFIRTAGFVGKAAPSAGNIGYAKELAPTLLAGKEMHVAIYDMTHADEVMRSIKDGIVPTLNVLHASSIVRRLTPTECERLQGLPDGYTEGGSDTARYKALGNGMAQPCAANVILRIAECAEEVR